MWGAIAGAVISAYAGHRSSNRAAQAHERGTRAGLDAQYRQFAQARRDLSPYRQTGQRALSALEQMAGLGGGDFQFEADPGYQFRLEEGQRAVERGAAARGGLFSGAHNKELTRFAQGHASEEFGRSFERLAGLAGMGQQAAGQQAQMGMQHGQLQMQGHQQIGQAQAAGHMGSGAALQQALGQGAMLYGFGQGQQGAGAGGTPNLYWQNEALRNVLGQGGG